MTIQDYNINIQHTQSYMFTADVIVPKLALQLLKFTLHYKIVSLRRNMITVQYIMII